MPALLVRALAHSRLVSCMTCALVLLQRFSLVSWMTCALVLLQRFSLVSCMTCALVLLQRFSFVSCMTCALVLLQRFSQLFDPASAARQRLGSDFSHFTTDLLPNLLLI